MYDCVVIGAGPAGLTAAIYLRRNNAKVVIIDKGTPGGQMTNTSVVENYPGFESIPGYDLALNMYNQAMVLNAEFINREVLKIEKKEHFLVYLPEQTIKTKTIIYATGMQHKNLNIPNEHKYINRGLSWCAVCDGSLYKNKIVAVVGGGNSALEESLYLANLASKVYLIHRRDTFRAEASLVDKVKKNKKIMILTNDEVVGFEGHKKLEKIILKSKQELEINGLFEYIGFDPNTALLKQFDVLNEQGFVIVDKHCQTNVKGLYAAGDVIDKNVRQIATATSDGAIAALHVIKSF